MKQSISLFPFRGLFTALGVDAPKGYASDLLNVRVGDGKIRPRHGYRNLQSGSESGLDTPVDAVHGFRRLNGYDDSNVNQEEWVSIEERNSVVRPYSVDANDGSRTEIKDGTSRVSLFGSSWVGFEFQGDSYWVNPDSTPSVYKHQIGDAASWSQIGAVSAPSTLTLGSPTYTTPDITGATITLTGQAASSSIPTQYSLVVQHTASGTGAASFTIDLSGSVAGVQDWTYADHFVMGFNLPTNEILVNWDSFVFQFINNDGSPVTINTSNVVKIVDSIYGASCDYTLYFDDKTRADWDNIRKIKVSYAVTAAGGTQANNLLVLNTSINVGAIDFNYPDSTVTNPVKFGITYYDSVNDIESDMKTATLYKEYLDSTRWYSAGTLTSGIRAHKLTFTWTASGSADKVRIYALINDQYLRIAEVDDTTLTYTLIRTRSEVIADGNIYTAGSFADQSGIVSGFAYKGWVVWLYSGGYQNVKHSRVGSPAVIAGDVVTDATDPTRPATYSLADNYADEPLGGVQAGEPMFLLGHEGVYAQAGDLPSEMTPPRKIPGSMGCAGKFAFARFRSDSGEPGVAWMDAHGSVWFAGSAALFAGDAASRPVELSAAIRGFPRDFLLTDQYAEFGYTDLSAAQMDVDEATGTLWIVMGRRALVLRPPSQIDQTRQWEAYEYKLTTAAGESTESLCTSFAEATGTPVSTARSGSTDAWTDPTSGKTSDDVYATSGALGAGDKTEYLDALIMPASSPISADATLTTLTVRIEHGLQPDPCSVTVTLDALYVLDSGVPISSNLASGQTVPADDTFLDIEVNVTGLGITPTKVNNGDISVRLGYTAS